MKKTRDNFENPVLNALRPIVIGSVVGAAACMILLICFAFALVMAKHMPQSALQPLTVFVAALGAFFSGYTAAKISKERGLLYGGCAALLLFLLLFAAGLTVAEERMTAVMITKGLIMVITGAIAGILAVNKKSRRK